MAQLLASGLDFELAPDEQFAEVDAILAEL